MIEFACPTVGKRTGDQKRRPIDGTAARLPDDLRDDPLLAAAIGGGWARQRPAGAVMGETTRRLAEFVATSRWEEVPAEARHEAKRCLVNFFAVALGGCNDPTIAKAAAVLDRFNAGRKATLER